MTREEAIAILEVSKHMATSGRMYNQAIDMAIEALSESSGDLISRADAMGAVQDHFNADGFKGYDDGQKMMDRIKVLPSADAVSREDTVTLNSPISIQAEMVAVVRCKDCRHRDLFSCPLADNDFQKDEDYCSWAERREP